MQRVLALGALWILVGSEKLMLQEAVDALLDTGGGGRAISGTGNRKLKSLLLYRE